MKMKKFMVVVLKPVFQTEDFILSLNEELARKYGASNPDDLFNSHKCLRELVDDYNHSTEGHPISMRQLITKYRFLGYGELHLELTGDHSEEEVLDAIAVYKWIRKTKSKYIDTRLSRYYRKNTLDKFLGGALTNALQHC